MISNSTLSELAIKYFSGNALDSEIDSLRDLISQSDQNRSEYFELKVSWMASSQIKKNNSIDTQKALRKFTSQIITPQVKTIYSIKHVLSVAAVFILIFLLGSLSTIFFTKKSNKLNNNECRSFVYCPKGSKVMTILPDGTQVWLNAGSNLSYNTEIYDKTSRQVTLIGEGFFKVAKNAKIPFIVNAKDLKIKAIGTEFDVKAYPEENIIETTLVQGIVKVEGADRDNKAFTITMTPKQKVTLSAGKIIIDSSIYTNPKTIVEKLSHLKIQNRPLSLSTKPLIYNVPKTDLYTSWKDDRWIFEGEEIGDLAILLERRFNVKISFDSDELKNYKFTGIFQNETIEQIMQVLKLTAPLNYKLDKGKIALTLDSTLKIKYKKYINSK